MFVPGFSGERSAALDHAFADGAKERAGRGAGCGEEGATSPYEASKGRREHLGFLWMRDLSAAQSWFELCAASWPVNG